jgi:endogenous inhibitor of DNA gyrase (YacG/DUF329 family)
MDGSFRTKRIVIERTRALDPLHQLRRHLPLAMLRLRLISDDSAVTEAFPNAVAVNNAGSARLRKRGMEMTDHIGFLRVCGSCFKLYETGHADGENQRCDCQPRQDARRWAGMDFNEHARLCACCGTEVLRSGSRYSPYFCRECQLLAMGVSLWERRLVIPIGRHSLMHAFVPAPRTPSLAAHGGDVGALASTVHTAMMAISIGSERLSLWSAAVVSRHLKRLGLAGGTSVSQYLAANARDEESPTRWSLFAEMCEFIRHSGSDPIVAKGPGAAPAGGLTDASC